MRVLRPIARTWTVLLGCLAVSLTLGLAVRLLLPLAPWNAPPALVGATPADGAVDVLPRSTITLRFSQPMNRQATLAALRIDPPTPGSFSWSPDAQTLTFQPAPALAAAVTYTVTLDQGALGRWWRPLAAPAQLRFRTAPPPAVVAALPEGAGVALDGALALVFSQPMVPPDQVGRPAAIPQIQVEPPLPADGVWVAADTLLLRPTAPLQAATVYTATIRPDLADLRGVELGRPFSWRFSTGWPALLAREPAPDARWVSPRAPLRLTLSAPLAPDLLRRALTISPTVEGDLSSAMLGATQVVTFTPRLGWAPDRSYQVALAAPPGSGLAPPSDASWRFQVEPLPALVAFFPGQGQLLPAGQAVRLVFSTPMERERLAAGLQIDPPVAEVPISVSETEVRLRPELRPSTLYTITVAAGTLDRSGEPLADPISVRLRTPPAAPLLRAPSAIGPVISLPISRTAAIDLERVNLAALSLSLYRLDTPTLLRALALRPAEWPGFLPERYGQPLARQWRADLADPLDTIARTPLPIDLGDGAPLPPGAYYLRVTTTEGPRLDLLLLVTPIQLTLRQAEGQLLVWATDGQTGAPVANAPIAVYLGEGLAARGSTGPDGLLSLPIARAPRDPPLLALAEGLAPMVARSDWTVEQPLRAEGPRYRSLVLLDQLEYAPGAAVRVRGQTLRRSASGALEPPGAATLCRLQLVTAGGPVPPPPVDSRCTLAADGAVGGSLRLDRAIVPGDYSVRVLIGDEQVALALRVRAGAPAPTVAVSRPGPEGLLLSVTGADGPVAGAVVSWTLDLEPLTAPARDGFTFGEPAGPPVRAGDSGQTGADGLLRIPLPAAARGWRYRLSALVQAPNAPFVVAHAQGDAPPGGPLAGLRLPSRISPANERSRVELLALDADGRPAPGVVVNVEVLPSGQAAGAPLLARRAVSGPDGRADVQLVQLRPGAYTIIARAGSRVSRETLWVFSAPFTGWANPPGQVGLIPDRPAYRPGEVARLLVTTPYTEAGLLLTQEQGAIRSAEVRPLRPGQLITVTITPEMAPALTLGAVLSAGGEQRVGAARLPVLADALPLTVTLASDRADYRPSASAALTVTLADPRGPASAALLVAITPADQAPDPALALERFVAEGAAPSEVALFPPGAPAPAGTLPLSLGLPGAARELSAGAGSAGVFVGRVPLPDRPGRWRIDLYAFRGAERPAVASTLVTTSLPLELRPYAPAALRPGDQAEATLELRNTSGATQTLTVELLPQGAAIAGQAAPRRQVLLPPAGAQQVIWPIALSAGATAPQVRFRVSGVGVSEERALPVRSLPGLPPAAGSGTTLIGGGALTATLELSPTADLVIAAAPSLRATLLEGVEALLAQEQRTLDDEASLLLIATGLARTAPDDARERWAQIAAASDARLRAAQNRDGGWGWWPQEPSEPWVSAVALEALAAARSLDPERPPLPARALDYLTRAAPDAAPDLRAQIAYALARAGAAPDTGAIPRGALSPIGLAYLSLADPAANGPGADSAAAPPHDRAVLAALTLQLIRERGQAAAAPSAERALMQRWGVGGWPQAFAAARVAAALATGSPADLGGPRRILFEEVPVASGPISGTLRLTLPAALREQIGGSGRSLRVEAADGSRYLLAYQLAPATPPAAPNLVVRYHDLASGAERDPDTLRLGEAIELELTLIQTQALRRADLQIALPAGLLLQSAQAHAPLRARMADPEGRSILLSAAPLPPGVYTLRVTAQVAAVGRFGAPPIRLSAPYDALDRWIVAPLPGVRAVR